VPGPVDAGVPMAEPVTGRVDVPPSTVQIPVPWNLPDVFSDVSGDVPVIEPVDVPASTIPP
jgi:hypothetical protein